jgi:hypothetical protein
MRYQYLLKCRVFNYCYYVCLALWWLRVDKPKPLVLLPVVVSDGITDVHITSVTTLISLILEKNHNKNPMLLMIYRNTVLQPALKGIEFFSTRNQSPVWSNGIKVVLHRRVCGWGSSRTVCGRGQWNIRGRRGRKTGKWHNENLCNFYASQNTTAIKYRRIRRVWYVVHAQEKRAACRSVLKKRGWNKPLDRTWCR